MWIRLARHSWIMRTRVNIPFQTMIVRLAEPSCTMGLVGPS